MKQNVGNTEPEFRHRGFGYWIFGYQGFIEPIIRASLAQKLASEGFFPLDRRIVVRAEMEAAASLLVGENIRGSLTTHERRMLSELLRSRQRLQLDLAFSGPQGVIIGEIKSWGGWGAFDLATAKGMFSTGRDALLFLLPEVQSKPVYKVILVVWGSNSICHDEVVGFLEERYGRSVQVEFANDLLRMFPPTAEIEVQLQRLHETCEDVTSWLDNMSRSVPKVY